MEKALNKSMNTGRGPSPAIWADCPWADIQKDPNVGWADWYDFTKFPTHAASSGGAVAATLGPFDAYVYQGGGITNANLPGGGITFASDGDNEGAAIFSMASAFKIAADQGRSWFECAFRTNTVADDKVGIFAGLIEGGAVAAAVPLTTAGALADKNCIGFQRREGTGKGAALSVTYKADGQTAVLLAADTYTGLLADTLYKVGWRFLPGNPKSRMMEFFVNTTTEGTNGGIRSTYLTYTQLAAATFPSDICLGFCFAVMNAAGPSPGAATLLWYRAAQLAR